VPKGQLPGTETTGPTELVAMPDTQALITGEFVRSLDERHRLALPPELHQALCPDNTEDCVLAKERHGCLSLWRADDWRAKVQSGVELIRQKIATHRLEGNLAKVQLFGRLLSTRFRDVKLGDRGRLVIPEGFRDFLGVNPGNDAVVIGAAVCVELWHPDRWRVYLQKRMPRFNPLFAELAG
jgi:MraZ protein